MKAVNEAKINVNSTDLEDGEDSLSYQYADAPHETSTKIPIIRSRTLLDEVVNNPIAALYPVFIPTLQ